MAERAWTVTIAWGSGGRDLDIFTTVSSGGQTTSGIGWNNGSQTSVIQVNSGGINGTFYAKWGGDDTGWAGYEIVTVYFRGTLPSGHAQIATVTPHCNYYGEGAGPATITVAGQSGSYDVAGPSTRYTKRAEASDPSVDVPLYADGGEPTPFPNLVTVSLNANGGSVSPSALYYITPTGSTKYGTLPTPTGSNGGVFQGWYTAASGGTLVDADSSLVSTSDHTLYAQWKYSVTLWRVANYPTDSRVFLDGTADDQGSGVSIRAWVIKDYPPGSTAELDASCQDALYRFAGWYRRDPGDPLAGGTLISTVARYSIVVNSALDIRGDFKFIGIYIRAVAVGGDGVVSINGRSDPDHGGDYTTAVLSGSTVTLGADIRASGQFGNIRFLCWQDSDDRILSRSNNYSFTAVGQEGSNQTYNAIYRWCSNIKSGVSPAGGGTIAYSRPADSPPDNPGDHWYEEGSSVSLTATPASGYTFLYWTSEGVIESYSATYTISSVGGDVDLVAHFKSDHECVITTVSAGNGRTTGDGVYTIGASCTITATPDGSYLFDRWELNGSTIAGAGAAYTFTVAGDATYTAYFRRRTGTVTTSARPANWGTTTGDGEYTDLETATVVATANSGFVFAAWIVNGHIDKSWRATQRISGGHDWDLVALFVRAPAGQLIYDDATGRLICADDGGGLLYHDEAVYNH